MMMVMMMMIILMLMMTMIILMLLVMMMMKMAMMILRELELILEMKTRVKMMLMMRMTMMMTVVMVSRLWRRLRRRGSTMALVVEVSVEEVEAEQWVTMRVCGLCCLCLSWRQTCSAPPLDSFPWAVCCLETTAALV